MAERNKTHLSTFAHGKFVIVSVWLEMTEGKRLSTTRAPNQALETLRELRRVARPFQDKLDIWQAQLAGLRVRQMTGLGLDLACEDAKLLSPLAAAARVELGREAHSAGFVVSEQSILRDLDRALLRLAETADNLIKDDKPAPAPALTSGASDGHSAP